jgi:RNA polymerase-interacting CarD/CdnL/TRCF family regulator
MSPLTAEEKELLTKAANLMDELLETLEVMQDKELVKDLKNALKEVKEGKARPLNELIKELKLEDEI